MSIHHYTQKEISQIKHSWLKALYMFFGCACIALLFNIVTKTVGNYSDIEILSIATIAYSLLFFSYGLTYYYGYKKPWKSFLLVNAAFGFILSVRDIILKMYDTSMMIMQGSPLESLILIIVSTVCFFAVKTYYYYMSYKLYAVYDYVESQE